MITTDLWQLSHRDAPFALSYSSRERCEEWRDRCHPHLAPDGFHLDRVAYCSCCGATGTETRHGWRHGHGITSWMVDDEVRSRCGKHHDRNPCAIEGCGCTTDRAGRQPCDDQYLCSKHWRPLTTPAERRVYQRIWRQARARERRLGAELMWPEAEVNRLERVWDRLVARARSRAAGDIDMAEINRLFGWD